MSPWERIMTVNLEAGSQQALAETERQFAGRAQGEDAAAKGNPWHHPFDWWDLTLLIVPIAIGVFGIWWEATGFRGR